MESVYLNLDFKYYTKEASIFATNNGFWHMNPFKFLNCNEEIIDNLSELSQLVGKLNQNDETNNITLLEPVETGVITVIMKGSIEFINYTRNIILQNYKLLNKKKIQLNELQFQKVVKDSVFLSKLSQLSQNYSVEVVLNQKRELIFYGNQSDLTIIETETRVLIDTMIDGLLVECIDVNISIVPLIGGANFINFNEIAKQLNANIYLPDLLPELYNSHIYQNHGSFKIWVTTSKMDEILTTKKLISNLINNLPDKFYSKTIEVSKEKLDLITLNQQMNILNIMFDNSCFIQLPKLGQSDKTIVIQGNNECNVNEAIESIHNLTSQLYKVLINNDQPMKYASMIEMIVGGFQLIVKVNYNGIEFVGKNTEVKRFLNVINASNMNFKTQLLIEISNDQKEFISGKKNGKILKVLGQINEQLVIKFLNYNEYQFIIDLVVEQAVTLNSLLYLIELIENELPSELKFNVPEIFHKSIIGNGGLIIQSIMKKYNVYIKFSSQNQQHNETFFNFKRFNNVLIKCPSKNRNNIALVKQEIDNLVYNCCENNLNYKFLNKNLNNSIYTTVKFNLLRSHYLLMVNNFKLSNLNNLEIEYQSYINWPNSYEEFNSNIKSVDIKGSDIKLKFFINNLISLLPKNYKFVLSHGLNVGSVLNSQKFTDEIVTNFKINYDIELLVFNNEIWLSYVDSSHLETALERLDKFLASNKVPVVEKLEFDYNPLEIDINNIQFDTDKKKKQRSKPLQRLTNRV